MVAHPVNATDRRPAAFQSLARRIHSPRPVALSTLHRREQEAYRHCERLEDALALLDPAGDAWGEVFRVLLHAYELHTTASRRFREAMDRAQEERHEAEELGAALMAERWLAYEHGGLDEFDPALTWEGE
jgi:hypothetical protein